MVAVLPGLAALAVLLVAWGLVYAGRAFVEALFYILKTVLKWTGGGLVLRGASWVWQQVGGNPIDPVSDAHRWLSRKLGEAADGIGAAVALSWNALEQLIRDTGYVLTQLAQAIENVRAFVTDAEEMAKRVIGTSAFALSVRAIARGLSDVKTYTNTIVKEIANPALSPVGAAIRVVTRIDRQAVADLRAWTTRKVRALEAAIAHAGAQALPWPGTAVGELRDVVNGLRRRLSRIEAGKLPYIAAGIFVATLARFGLGWLRCDRVKQFGRGACRTQPDAIESLLDGMTLIVGALSFRAFVREMHESADDGLEVVRSVIR